MSPFLTEAQLIDLTGYMKKSKQAEWLRNEGIPHRINGLGRPIVMTEDLLSGSSGKVSRDPMPDLVAMGACNA